MNYSYRNINSPKRFVELSMIFILILLFCSTDFHTIALEDTSGPVIESISVDRTEATVRDTVTYTMVITDESGLSWGYMNLSNGTNIEYVYLSIQTDGTYKGTLVVDNSFLNGAYKVDSVSLNDSIWNNRTYFSEEIAAINPNLEVTVAGSAEDTTGPLIESIAVDRTEATVGDIITYTVSVIDESGLSWGTLNISNGTNMKYVNIYLQEGGSYKGTLVVDNSFLNAVYKIDSVTLGDTATNNRTYFSEEITAINPNLEVTVAGSAEDTTGPVIESITVDRTVATVGETITYIISATDESGLAWASMNISNGTSIKYINLNFQEDGTYKGTQVVDNTFLNGVYKVEYVTINDKSGNSRYYPAEEIAAINPNLGVSVTGSAEDTTGPVIEYITVDKTEAVVGDTITYLVKANDVSGLSWASMNVSCGTNMEYVSLNIQEDGVFKGTLVVDNTFLNKVYIVNSVSLNDKSGNSRYYSAEEISALNPSIGVTVTGSAEDTTGPVIESITVDRTEATVGDTITYTVKAIDVSGLAWASINISNGVSNKYVVLNLQADGTYKGTIVVNNTFMNGIYKVDSVFLSDSIWNNRSYTADEITAINPSIGVTVTGSSEDAIGPVIESISVNMAEATVGDTITYTILATDKSGVSSINMNLVNGSSRKYLSLALQADGTYQGSLFVNNTYLNGLYEVDSVTLNDTLQNYRTYYDYEIAAINPDVGVTITGSAGDIAGPVIESIAVDKLDATLGDIITYTVYATDESGLSWASINISSGTSMKYVNMTLQADGTYKGSIVVDNTFLNGIYKVNSVSLSDKSGNSRYYSADDIALINSALGISVSGSLEDTTGPVIQSISVDRTDATVGETITYTVNATDESGLSWGSMNISSGTSMKYMSLLLQADGSYKGKLVVDNSFLNGTYEVYSIHLNDNVSSNMSNQSSYYSEEIAAINPNLGVAITGSGEDTTGPAIESITVDRTEAIDGDIVTYMIQATDESGLAGALLELSCGSSMKNVELISQANGTLKGYLVVDNSFLNGTYGLDSAYIFDNSGNSRSYSAEELRLVNPNLDVTVTGSIEDTTGPVIESITVDITQATPGDTITYIMQISDDSGFTKEPTMGISNGISYLTIGFILQDNGTYKGTIAVDNSFLNGLYGLRYIELRDKFDNYRVYEGGTPEISELNANLDFYVTGSTVNNVKPVIDAASLKAESINTTSGEAVKVSVSITDEANPIKSVEIAYLNLIYPYPDDDYFKKYTMTYNVVTQKYECIISLNDGLESGLWQAIYIIANKGLPNEVQSSNGLWDLTAGNFVVPDAIHVTGIIIDTTEIKFVSAGETKTIIATVVPAEATNKKIIWKSSDDSVAAVSIDGIVRAIGNGKAIITATTEEGKYSASCEVTVEEAPMIITQPTDQTVTEGQTAIFSAVANTTHTLTVQWQGSIDGGTTWNDILGATSATLSITAGLDDNGNKYRAVFTNTVGTATSNVVTLSVNQKVWAQITISVNNLDWGSASGSGQYAIGKSITVKAIAKEGYNFIEWQEDGIRVSTSADYRFKVSKNDRELVAVFQPSLSSWPTEIKLSCSVISSSSVILSLNKPVNGAAKYVIYYGSNRIEKPASEGISWAIDGLLKGTQYTFTIQVIYDDLIETASGPSITIKMRK